MSMTRARAKSEKRQGLASSAALMNQGDCFRTVGAGYARSGSSEGSSSSGSWRAVADARASASIASAKDGGRAMATSLGLLLLSRERPTAQPYVHSV
jgi:hypothetical protein